AGGVGRGRRGGVPAPGALVLLLGLASAALAQDQLPPTVELVVPNPPLPASAGGQAILVWELHVTNLGRTAVALTQVEVLAEEAKPRVLGRYAGRDLETADVPPGAAAPARASAAFPAGTQMTPAGMRAIVRIWVAVDRGAVPYAVRHRVSIEGASAEGKPAAGVIVSLPTEVRRQAALVLDPPFRGGAWDAANRPPNRSLPPPPPPPRPPPAPH